MRIGDRVKQHIKTIFHYCETVNPAELNLLLDLNYAKKTFRINYPFCTEVSKIVTREQSVRYWTTTYLVGGKIVRVSSQWLITSEPYFLRYLAEKEIVKGLDASVYQVEADKPALPYQTPRPLKSNSRYRGNAVGNAQNAVIRNILSRLGQESFNEENWVATKAYFSEQCAYCGAEGDLVIEHAIPINRAKLGEHRLGNLVPSCQGCNNEKAGKDFREFLGDNTEAIRKIEEYMDSRNYVPLEDNEQMKMVLNVAYKEVSALADRYIVLINELSPQTSTVGTEEN